MNYDPSLKRMVYIMRPVGMLGPVKIGVSRWPDNRLSEYMAWSPIPLEMVWTTVGEQQLERNLHNFFSASWSHNEWFHPTDHVVSHVARLIAGERLEDVVDLNSPLSIFMVRRKSRQTSGKVAA